MAWISPTGHSDLGSDWSNEKAAYDDSLATYTYSTGAGWSELLQLTLSSGILCNKIRFYANTEWSSGRQIDIDVYYDAGWHDVYEGSFSASQWVEKSFSGPKLVEKARVRLFHGQSGYRWLYEFDFWQIEPSAPGYGNCLGVWKMNDNAANTTVVDSSGNGNDGTAQQNTSVLHTDGRINGALTFNGTSDYVSVPPSDSLCPTQISVAFWFNKDINALIVPVGRINTNGLNGFNVRFSAGNWIQWRTGSDTEGDTLEVNGYLTNAVWQLITVTYDGSVKKIYKNGVLLASKDYSGGITYNPARKLEVGRYPEYDGQYFDGKIDAVMIFDKALSDEEIVFLWNDGNGKEQLAQPHPLVGGSLASGERRLAG